MLLTSGLLCAALASGAWAEPGPPTRPLLARWGGNPGPPTRPLLARWGGNPRPPTCPLLARWGGNPGSPPRAVFAWWGAKPKEVAPRFIATTTTGEKFNNQSVKGKVVLLEFWTTWCAYCADEAPFVDKIGQEYANKGLAVLAINVGESKKTVKKYLEQHPRGSKIVLMVDTNLAAMYQATVYPIYVVIDKEGYVAGTQRGAAGEAALRDLLSRGGLDDDDDDANDKNDTNDK